MPSGGVRMLAPSSDSASNPTRPDAYCPSTANSDQNSLARSSDILIVALLTRSSKNHPIVT